MIDHSSESRFSTGVPVSARRKPAGIWRITWVWRAAGFLMFWASSRITACHWIDCMISASWRTRDVTGEDHVDIRVLCWKNLRRAGEMGLDGYGCSRPGAKRRTSRSQLVTTEVGADQQHGSGNSPSISFSFNQEGQRLDGFAQAHIVSQAGAQPPLAEECQPGITIDLVRAQFTVQPGGLGKLFHLAGMV